MEMNKFDALKMMTPEMIATLKKQNELVEDAFSTNVTYEKMRENYNNERKFWNEGGPEPKKSVDLELEGPYGTIGIRIHYPQKRTGKGSIVYIHGGGFVVGNLDTHSRIMRILMEETESVVIGIDYHLAPEYKYPTQVEECAFLVEWLRSNAEEYDLDKNDISLAGDSGGANLSLATALYLRDKKDDVTYLRSLLLYYGAFGLTDSRSRRIFGGDYDGLGREDLKAYSKMYIEDDNVDLRYFDCFSNDLTKGVPPCYIAYGDLDPLQDDSILLYDILTYNNGKAELEEFKGVIHAFLHHSRILPEAKEAIKNGANFYKSLIHVGKF
ncbi:acetyl esterase [Psychrobacillus soli]|uniref:Acetyl esterase n=1 Tax=Psychrobacillus soli TaxID=1543965 RepID=A0A544TDQ7_9BACI|nr:acetyl esterase [Psychrobacillus soli]TQR15598.1 acetyl esterase [Psychrobacillus soli]